MELPDPFIIAIDGPAASGKGTIARELAKFFNLPHIDTGLAYRAVAFEMNQANIALDDETKACEIAKNLNLAKLQANVLRGESVGEMAAKVAVLAKLRQTMKEKQQFYTKQSPGIVMDGRDIGSVICPEAHAKLFITAKPEIRAQRRYLEMKNKGMPANQADILADIINRDEKDKTRKIAPLQQTADSHLCDTSNLSINEAVSQAKKIVKKIILCLHNKKDMSINNAQ